MNVAGDDHLNPRLEFSLVIIHAGFAQALSFGYRPVFSYATLEAGGQGVLLGVLTASFAVPSLFLALPVGRLMDRLGERTILLSGPIAMVAAGMVSAFNLTNVIVLIAATALVGIGHLASVVSTQAVVANRFRSHRSDKVFGYYTFAASIGQAVGPLFIALPGPNSDAPPVLLIVLCFMAMSVVQLAFSLPIRSTRRPPVPAQDGVMVQTRELLRLPGVVRALIANAIVITSIDLYVVYAPLLGQERSLGPAVVSGVLVARAVASMASRLFLGFLVARLGRRRLTMTSIFAAACALGLLLVPLQGWGMVMLAAVYGFFIGVCQPITLAWMSELAPTGVRGLAMSLRIATNRLGQTRIPLVFGILAVNAGSSGVLAAVSASLVFAVWSSAALPRNSGEDA